MAIGEKVIFLAIIVDAFFQIKAQKPFSND